MRYRVGRHNPQLVYSVLSDDPEDRGALLVVCFTAGVAEQVVKALNAVEPQPGPVIWIDDEHTAFTMTNDAIAETMRNLNLDAPAPVARCGADSPLATWVKCTLDVGHEDWHAGTYSHWPARWPQRPAPADEPVPVPPPVDALLSLVDELYQANEAAAIDVARGNIVMAARDLWAAGVEEGRRQATEERTEEIDRLHALLEQHAEQYARDLQDGGYVPLAMDDADYAEETAERSGG